METSESDKNTKSPKNYFDFDFALVKEYTESLPEAKEQISYLIEAKTRYDQRYSFHLESPNFSEICKSEIEMLKGLMELQATAEKTTDADGRTLLKEHKETNIDEKLEKSLTNRQWLIAMRFFVDAFKLRSINKTDFARLLTVMNNGKNFQGFRADFDARDLITAKTANDAQKIANLFRKVKLLDIAVDIENNIDKLKT